MSTWRFGLVAEDDGCAQNAQRLADRLLMGKLRNEWRVDPDDDLGTWRRWTGIDEGVAWELFRAAGPRRAFGGGRPPLPGGPFGGGPWLAKLRSWSQHFAVEGVDLVVFALDQDRKPDRRAAVNKFIDETHWTAVALMNPEGEAWRIVAFRNPTASQQRAHRDIVSALTFDPVREPHRLHSTTPGSDRDAKAILQKLLDGRSDEWMVWFDRAVDDGWSALPHESGLPQYLDRFRSLMDALVSRRAT